MSGIRLGRHQIVFGMISASQNGITSATVGSPNSAVPHLTLKAVRKCSFHLFVQAEGRISLDVRERHVRGLFH